MIEGHKELAGALSQAAGSFVETLSAEQRASALFGFPDDDQRRDWAYFPRNHPGLPLHEMDRRQRKLAHKLISTGLSVSAYAKVTTIMGLESVLNLLEGGRADSVRDPGRYFVSVFGVPGADCWGYRFEGHHVCLNYTIVGDSLVSATPSFLGANPASVRHGNVDVVRPCAEEEELGRELLHSLDDAQTAIALLAATAPPDFVLANSSDIPDSCALGELGTLPQIMARIEVVDPGDRAAVAFERHAPKGLPAADMSPGQQALLRRLMAVYVERLPEETALVAMQRLDTMLEVMHFAWAGGRERGEGHYYRIQGGTLLVEYDNTQDGANHVHSAWRDTESDFGDDALRRHLAEAHTG